MTGILSPTIERTERIQLIWRITRFATSSSHLWLFWYHWCLQSLIAAVVWTACLVAEHHRLVTVSLPSWKFIEQVHRAVIVHKKVHNKLCHHCQIYLIKFRFVYKIISEFCYCSQVTFATLRNDLRSHSNIEYFRSIFKMPRGVPYHPSKRIKFSIPRSNQKQINLRMTISVTLRSQSCPGGFNNRHRQDLLADTRNNPRIIDSKLLRRCQGSGLGDARS